MFTATWIQYDSENLIPIEIWKYEETLATQI